ncbi:MAG: hypothetical protein DMG64_13135 [Acidobacteria bacterium]|nr:MAG: hypothetical protein DMG64_13135 [Acidobacteriota bacterium]
MVYLDMKILFMEVYENKELRDRFARAEVASHAGTNEDSTIFRNRLAGFISERECLASRMGATA